MVRKKQSTAAQKPSVSNAGRGYFLPNDTQSDFSKDNARNSEAYSNSGYYPVAPSQPKPGRKPFFKNNFLYTVVIVTLLSLFAYSSYQIVLYALQTRLARQEEQTIGEMIADSQSASADIVAAADAAADDMTLQAEPTQPPAVADTDTDTPAAALIASAAQPTAPDVLIQFTNALAVNPDTVGQLEMGESINTYVVQRDNAYYLRHSFSGEYSISGAIFLDVSCSIYPQSRNLIIHGHNMQNGTAFGKLSRFESLDYLNQYPILYFSTLYESAEYRPFAALYYSIDPQADNYLDLYQVNYLSDQGFIAFINTVQLRSVYHVPANVGKDDKILTVITCATDDESMRFAVIAVKINK